MLKALGSLFVEDIKKLKGVGPKSAVLLNKLGVFSIGDLINFYPKRYEDWTDIRTLPAAYGQRDACVKVEIASDVKSVRLKNGRFVYTLDAFDETAGLEIVFFNNVYAAKSLKKGCKYLLMGTLSRNFLKYKIISPKIKNIDDPFKISPIYSQVNGISSNKIALCVKNAVDMLPEHIKETLPENVLIQENLCSLDVAVRNIHFPKNRDSLKSARKRLVFEEFFIYHLGMLMIKNNAKIKTDIKINKDFSDDFYKLLPFKLTGEQIKAVNECMTDMLTCEFAMNRLLQGDVGSGKTVVATALIHSAVKNGYQAVFMVPTEILARQHYNTLSGFLSAEGIKIALLTASVKNKKKIKNEIASGEAKVIIGTHALLSESVEFNNLGFIVTDEQHRFGVNQRALLVAKGQSPHVLVMSATPIPRTLALIIYGDLDISVLGTALPGRQKIDTFKIESDKRERALDFLQKAVSNGNQGYIVCAGIDENENNIEDVMSYGEKLIKSGFNMSKVGILHGKLSPKEKEETMKKFVSGELNVLVSTTVIEVGVDVPEASIIIIENAERFGISQLHQLRGRVGRGTEKSYCILISDAKGKESVKRFNAMVSSDDGFYLSEEDLKIRGPGDFFGVNQHGVPNIKLATTYDDINIMKKAHGQALDLLKSDPKLEGPELKFIKRKISRLFLNFDDEPQITV